MKTLLIVGAGGIGSWLAGNLYESKIHGQLDDLDITIADPDTVDQKNIGYQNFTMTDLLDNKAEVLANRYFMHAIPKKITDSKILDKYDCIVSAVDNSIFRRTLFDYSFTTKGQFKYWIDLRSEGRTVAIFTKAKQSKEILNATLPAQDVDNGSCQLSFELDKGIIQRGNKIVAAIGEQTILNWYRGEPNVNNFSYRF